jgi:uncharacterized protein YcaQ
MRVRAPGQIDAAALVAPFDPVCIARVGACLGFISGRDLYRRRRARHYVPPFLLLTTGGWTKADRLGRRLVVPAAYAERGVNRGEAARAPAVELRTMAEWLGLESVAVVRRGDLARELGAAVK